MKFSKRNRNILYFSLLMIGFVVFVFYKSSKNEKSLDRNLNIIDVVVKKVTIYKGKYFLLYTFKTKNETISGQTALRVENTNLSYLNSVFAGQKLLLAVDSVDNENNILLLSNSDYERFHIIPSDTVTMALKKIDSLR